MKHVIQFVFVLFFSVQLQAQDDKVTTQSVTIENLIPFVVENYTSTSEGHNITLLIETTKRSFTSEESTIIKQAVKYLSGQLTEDDTISIVAYNTLNGIVLEETSAKNLKKILNAINDFSDYIREKPNNGITIAYNYVDENFKEDVVNTLIMIRNPNGSRVLTSNDVMSKNNLVESTTKKSKNNMVLLTAIAVLPELIAIIKN